MAEPISEYEVETDAIYEHRKTGALYETHDFCKVKQAEGSDTTWVVGVIYSPKGNFFQKYACSVNEFVSRFKEI